MAIFFQQHCQHVALVSTRAGHPCHGSSALKLRFWTSKIIPNHWLVDLFWPMTNSLPRSTLLYIQVLYYIIFYYIILYYIILYYIILYLFYNSYYLNSVMSGNEGIDMQSDFFIRIRQKNPNQSSTGTSYEQNQGKILFKIVHCTVLLLFRCIRGSTRRTQPRFWALFSNMMTPLMTGRRQTF